ncbi:signal recognition particle Sec65p subunit [[Candida] railenensis]|uniref:Signal recognition particle SEC65 subunit n=1 Tax=[Candida] railenensis TaxID=45579 RepID=A0A9P0QPN8_9ASCO|nr:signal recognition particle Sec65p subunit [[Candida] railenensis]
MSNRPVLEEVDDDDIDMDLDIAQFDPQLRTPIAPIQRAQPPVMQSSYSQVQQQPQSQPTSKEHPSIVDPNKFTEEERNHLKKFQLIYPCYFDKNRSHKEGRRVSSSKAVNNPLAKTISDACRHLFLQCMLELDKTHPQDFGNPGRVRVFIKENGTPQDQRFKTKRELLDVIADYLISHPTTLDSIGPKSGIPLPREYEVGGNFEPEEVPKVKGFKMNSIVPVHSPLSIKHPMTKSIYDPEPEQVAPVKAPNPNKMKKKVKMIRG